MRIAVAGGTGLAGRHTVAALRRAGHDAVVLARSVGVDLATGDGLAAALAGADAVIDASNTPTTSAEQARAFFATATRHLLAAEHHAGVRRHVVLSIVGVDRVQGTAHYAGKRAQEQAALAGPEPQDLVDMTRRTLAARGESLRLVPSWRGLIGVEAAGEVLLPGPDAQIAPTTFETWLATQT